MVRLTLAQRKALEAASRPSGAVGFGQKYKVMSVLRRRGLVQPLGRHGYMVVTTLGRAALSEVKP